MLNQARRYFSSSSMKLNQAFPKVPGNQKIKKFYKKVEVLQHTEKPLESEIYNELHKNTKIDVSNLSQVRENESYWGISLDGRAVKTMYKDELFIPSRCLAVAMAEEWENQQEYLDVNNLHLNNMFAKGTRSHHDLQLQDYMVEEI